MSIDLKDSKRWLGFALLTTVFWGLWGALIEIPEQAGFPATLGYTVWALTMIIPCFFALRYINWELDFRPPSILYGCLVGFLGAGGQLILFQALRDGPAYLVFPFVSLSPVVTVLLATFLLRENTSFKGWLGVALALLAIPFLSYQEPTDGEGAGYLWIILALLVFLAWGIQAFIIRFANRTMKAENLFFYMTATGLALIPIAILMTDFSQDINWGLTGPYAAAAIHILNAVGALSLVFALRYGKAIIVSPMTNAIAPVITVVISLSIYAVIPHPIILTGMIFAVTAAILLSVEEETVNIAEEGEETAEQAG